MTFYDNFKDRYKSEFDQNHGYVPNLDFSSLDQWRHLRMLNKIRPFIETGSSWLTIGDGRYGNECQYLTKHGADAHASDLCIDLLEVAKENDLIKSFSRENAESLSFDDCTFDYVLIKEALHHLPRPWIGLHEAFRVCRKAVVLIEPNDQRPVLFPADTAFRLLKNIAKQVTKKGSIQPLHRYQFEDVGNFVFSFNQNELEKFLLGMHYRHISYCRLNDLYLPEMAKQPTTNKNGSSSANLTKLKSYLSYLDMLCNMGVWRSNMIVAALHKASPSLELISNIKSSGWTHKQLPKNPYI